MLSNTRPVPLLTRLPPLPQTAKIHETNSDPTLSSRSKWSPKNEIGKHEKGVTTNRVLYSQYSPSSRLISAMISGVTSEASTVPICGMPPTRCIILR
jgi:hypothetical protein